MVEKLPRFTPMLAELTDGPIQIAQTDQDDPAWSWDQRVTPAYVKQLIRKALRLGDEYRH